MLIMNMTSIEIFVYYLFDINPFSRVCVTNSGLPPLLRHLACRQMPCAFICILNHSCLEISLTIAIGSRDTFENYLRIR